MATLSASTQSNHNSIHRQDYFPEEQYTEGSYSEQGGPQEATIEGWRDLA
jgi:hypothetical protein